MALHDMRADGIFLTHLILEGRHHRAFLKQAQRDLHRLRRLGLERGEVLLRPIAVVSCKRGKDIFEFGRREQPVDFRAMREDAGLRSRPRLLRQNCRDGLRIGGDSRLCRIEAITRHIVRRQTERETLRPVQPMPGQRQILARAPRQAR